MSVFKKYPFWSVTCAAAIAYDIVTRSWGWLVVYVVLAMMTTIYVDRKEIRKSMEAAAVGASYDAMIASLPGAHLGALLFKLGVKDGTERCFALNRNGTLALPPEITQEMALKILWMCLRPPESEQDRPPAPPLRKSAA